MPDISMWEVEENTYEIEIDDGGAMTSMMMVVSDDELREVGLEGSDAEDVARESVQLIVEQGVTNEIAHDLTLGDLVEFAPAWIKELKSRVV